jgi:hypothetical protein
MGALKFQAIEFHRNASWTLGTEHTLLFSATGNLEIRSAVEGTLVWQTQTNGDRLVMQEDGNLVIYSTDGEPVWASNSWGNRNAVLLARDDASLEIVSENGDVVWRAAPQNVEADLPMASSAAFEDFSPERSEEWDAPSVEA